MPVSAIAYYITWNSVEYVPKSLDLMMSYFFWHEFPFEEIGQIESNHFYQ
jgi:hypothetical protein